MKEDNCGTQNCGCGPMVTIPMENSACREPNQTCGGTADMDLNDEACCGPSNHTVSNPFEKPGYKILPYVKRFHHTDNGTYPVIYNDLKFKDKAGTVFTRFGYNRSHYKVSPGLYCSGAPDENSDVFVSANYKISFDHLRRSLKGLDAWILVIDTMGVNVWCAAGKKTFSTGEISTRIKNVGLDKIVKHRKIVVPQLGAPGVSAREVKKNTGFKVVWGPVYTKDIPKFVENKLKTDNDMRKVTFSMAERTVLVPVEVMLVMKISLIIILALFVISGFGPGIFGIDRMVDRGSLISLFFLSGIFAGAVVTPVFLPFLPGKPFALKGIFAALISTAPLVYFYHGKIAITGLIAMLLVAFAISSYLAMNFTGATPYTSPSGVEKEMRKAIPVQLTSVIIALFLWVFAAF
ncbi:MAG: hypothetical protein GY714_09865 [Desulfobacterales bacterium]|nr:hypothetical protein [Desulfobacterales bacterium]MCP4160541.1 hypothetical protein [Deltaproteobacteria bacterium]